MNDIGIEAKKYGPRKSQGEWAEINELWEKSQKPRKEFCAELGISYTSFAYWRQRLKKEKGPKTAAAFAIARANGSKESSFTGTPSPLKIHYPNGIVLSLYCELNSQTVSTLQRLLEVPLCR